MSRTKYWCFTINNYDEPTTAHLDSLFDAGSVSYLVYGRELAPSTGTPHLQGFAILNDAVRRSRAKSLLSPSLGGHFEPKRGSTTAASEYCKKDGNYSEFGTVPAAGQGRRSDWESFREFVLAEPGHISDRLLFAKFPHLYARYRDGLHDFVRLVRPDPVLVGNDDVPRDNWQSELYEILMDTPDPRKISFVVDPTGNTGKSWFCQFMMTHHGDETQVLCVGKRDDLACSVMNGKRIYLFDVARGQLEHFQYCVPEMIKNRMVYSPKYKSQMKILDELPHVVVFTNEEPDMQALSIDRYHVINTN